MPAPVTPSSPRSASPNPPQKPRIAARSKKSRVIRRRGRARGGIESDDEIERVLSTDSNSDSDDSLSLDSATNSEQESESEDDITDRQIDAHTPNTSHSSSAVDKDGATNGKSTGAFFSTSGNWSEMVADENANGAADLPVIEFSDFNTDVATVPRIPSKKARKAVKRNVLTSEKSPSPSMSSTSPIFESVGGDGLENAGQSLPRDKDASRRLPSHPKRPLGQSARQAYQQKLESDPSFVPKVGGFWGHDDRLMDKDLRSLSGWWRGKWQGRGRGRGGFAQGHGRRASNVVEDNEEETVNIPPIDRPWTHDGFEEMKRKEEQRSEVRVQCQATSALRGVARGTPVARGTRLGFPRGGFVNMGGRIPFAARPGRVWFAMKPEHMWTKQSENFLFFDSKYRALGPTYRIQLPGSEVQVIKSLPSSHSQVASNHATTATARAVSSDAGDYSVVVRLPKREEEPLATVSVSPLDDVFKVRPHLNNVERIPLPVPLNTKSSPSIDRTANRLHSSSSAGDSESAARSCIQQLTPDAPSSDPTPPTQTEQAVPHDPAAESPAGEAVESSSSQTTSRRLSLPPIQTVHSPPPAQPSPAYPSSYAYPTLPPGIALNQHGLPYEMATGRPVYIPTTAPPPMYNPRPIMHSHLPQHSLSYMSPHIHPSSAMSPDFTAHQSSSHSHTPSIGVNGFIDPATGVPMFSLPRSSRVEIRAPGDNATKSSLDGKDKASLITPSDHRSSHMPTTLASYSNSPSHPGPEYGYNSYSSSSDVSTLPSYASLPEASASTETSSSTTQPLVHYPAAYQQYYYPDPIYTYPQYMDVSQVGQYEMYPPMEGGTTYY